MPPAIKGFLKLTLSPTRLIFDLIAHFIFGSKPPVRFYYIWGAVFLALSLTATLTFELPIGLSSWHQGWFSAFVWFVPFSRIAEISFAFYRDAVDRLAKKPKRTPRLARLNLLAISYVELSVQFAVLYLSLPQAAFGCAIKSPMDALFFSWATITTTGYGDITPKLSLARSLSMFEVGIGLMLLVFAVGSYLSSEAIPNSPGEDTTAKLPN